MSTLSDICRQIQQLTLSDQLRLLEELIIAVRRRADVQPKRSILELKGLGKETWQGIDARLLSIKNVIHGVANPLTEPGGWPVPWLLPSKRSFLTGLRLKIKAAIATFRWAIAPWPKTQYLLYCCI